MIETIIPEHSATKELRTDMHLPPVDRSFLYAKKNRHYWIKSAENAAYREVKDALNIKAFSESVADEFGDKECAAIFLGVGDSDSEIKFLHSLQEAGVNVTEVGVHEHDLVDAKAEAERFRKTPPLNKAPAPHAIPLSGSYDSINWQAISETRRLVAMRGYHFANEQDSRQMLKMLKEWAGQGGLVYIDFGTPTKNDWRRDSEQGFSELEKKWFTDSFADFLAATDRGQAPRTVDKIYSRPISLGHENGIERGQSIVIVGRASDGQEYEINRYNRLNPDYIKALFASEGLETVSEDKTSIHGNEPCGMLARVKEAKKYSETT